MAMIELVDFNELYSNNKSATETTNKKSTRRSRTSKKSKAEDSSETN
jgi:hypothetical protein